MNNAKTYETNKEGNKGDSIKALTGLKGEATSLSSTIKKSLSQSLALSKQLKEKINMLKAKEAEKNVQRTPEVVKDVEKTAVEENKHTASEVKYVSENKKVGSERGFRNDRGQQERTMQGQNRQFGQNKGENNYRSRHFTENNEGNHRGFSQNGQRQGFQRNQGTVGDKRAFGQNAGNNGAKGQYQQNGTRAMGTRPFGNRTTTGSSSTVDSFELQQKNKTENNKTQAKRKTNEHSFEEKKSLNRKALVMRGFIADESLENEDGIMMGSRKIKGKKAKQQETVTAQVIDHAVITTENLTVKLLAEKIGKPAVEIIKKFMILGNMVNINSTIAFDEAELIAGEFGVTLEQKLEKTAEQQLSDIKNIEDSEQDLEKRPPVVTVMGHVDHGKTSLLDYIRETNVIAGEAGGITQHIGAYTIEKNGEMITFIDTPGHAAFTAMRERGAKMTDIAILVVAADDGVMPQTIEAISEIKQVKAPMIVAVNKIDKPEANIDRIKQQLTEHDVIPEEWGGDAIIIPISAKTGQNIDKLLEMILFVAEYQNLRANPKRKAIGTVIEAKLDKGKGTVATILVQNGTLKVGDVIIAGTSVGKVRAMINEKGKNVKSAGPSYAVSVLGLSSVPNAGDEMYAVDEKMSKKVLSERMVKEKTDKIKSADNSVDALMDRFKETEFKNYNVIIKADVQGSLEALTHTLSEVMNEEVKVRCIHGGVGAINENDIMMATASNAVIVGFNTKPDFKAKVLADKYKVNIQFNKIIYEVVDYVTKQIDAMKTPKYKENISGKAEIRMIFKASKVGAIAGCYILDGKLTKGQQVKVYRKNDIIYTGNIATIQREKDEVKEISAGFECGIVLKDFSQIQVGDIIEGITLERIN